MTINANVIKQAMNTEIAKATMSFSTPKQSYDFLVDTINRAGTLSKLQYLIKSVPSGNIDALTFGKHNLRLRDKTTNEVPAGTNNMTERQIPFAVKSLDFDIWLDNDEMYYYAAREALNLKQQPDINNASNLKALVISAEQKMLAMDLQDLIFNGDTGYEASKPDTDFYKILNGFVPQLSKSPNKKDITTAALTLEAFADTVALLPEEYKSNFGEDIKWFINQSTHDKIFKLLSARTTNLGDGVVVNGKVTRLYGYDVEVVSGMLGYLKTPGTISDGRVSTAILTPMANLVPVSTKNPAIEFKSVDNDTIAIKKGATYHNWKLYIDAIVKEVKASAILIGDNV